MATYSKTSVFGYPENIYREVFGDDMDCGEVQIPENAKALLAGIVNKMDNREKRIFKLRYIKELSTKQVADIGDYHIAQVRHTCEKIVRVLQSEDNSMIMSGKSAELVSN